MATPTVIVGTGNAFRRDDGAGLATARRLGGILPDDIRVLEQEGDLASLLDAWQGAAAAVLIDATSSGSEPGTIRRYEAHERPLPSVFSRSSTHSFGVAEAIELARALGQLPARVVVFGIEGHDFAPGEGLSPEVDAAVDEVVRRVSEEATGLGALSHFSPDHFREHFEHASRGTVAEGASLEIERLTDISDPRAQDVTFDSADIEQT